jgi:hypothetical protein
MDDRLEVEPDSSHFVNGEADETGVHIEEIP